MANKKRRSRPLIITAICVLFFYFNLGPTSTLYGLILGLSQDYYQGGWDRFHAAYRSGVTFQHYLLLGRVVLMFVAIGGMWNMRIWGIVILDGFIAFDSWGALSAGYFSPITAAFNLIALVAPWLYFIKLPSAQQPRPTQPISVPEPSPGDSDDSQTGERRKNPINELIY